MRRLTIFLIIAALLSACASRDLASTPTAQPKTLAPAVQTYLKDHGDFCLGKFTWPIAVMAQARRSGSNDAVQMPVLERLGLVASASAVGDPTVKVYDLTPEGRKYYVDRKAVTVGPQDKVIDHPRDFCAAKLTLNKIVGWDPIEVPDGRAQTTVRYTYKVTSAADWAQDPQLRKVFPRLDQILAGEGTLQLTQLFVWSEHRWVAVTRGG